MKKLVDKFGRVLDYLRFSVTDRCNLNCVYCNPRDNKLNLLKDHEMLSNAESLRLIGIFVKHFEFRKIRFTGGEPLAGKNIVNLIAELKPLHESYGLDIGITTNGTLLKAHLDSLKQSGVTKLNISLDSLDKDKFCKITGKDKFESVMDAVLLAEEIGFQPLKINCVVMKGINDDEILEFVDFVKNRNINIRFIEYMPFSGNKWCEGKFISYMEIKDIIEKKFRLIAFGENNSEVANNYHIAGYKGIVSFISSISNHFCDGCNRLRITSEGSLKLCLFSPKYQDLDMKNYLRTDSFSDTEIAEIIEHKVQDKVLMHPDISELLKLEKNNMLSIGG
ncbi:MAG: GTP 3',8-cyclase MoaA [Ignavibacteria bacterium]|nr:GTP 3',8-cyclase MoaA [Ignavibacteria bacterium]